MMYKAEQELDKKILLSFTGNEAEKVKVAQWLDEGCNAARIKWNRDARKDDVYKEKVIGNSMTMAGIAVMCSLTPPSLAVGAATALLGQTIKFIGRAKAISKDAKTLIRDAKFDTARKERAQTAQAQAPKAPKV